MRPFSYPISLLGEQRISVVCNTGWIYFGIAAEIHKNHNLYRTFTCSFVWKIMCVFEYITESKWLCKNFPTSLLHWSFDKKISYIQHGHGHQTKPSPTPTPFVLYNWIRYQGIFIYRCVQTSDFETLWNTLHNPIPSLQEIQWWMLLAVE